MMSNSWQAYSFSGKQELTSSLQPHWSIYIIYLKKKKKKKKKHSNSDTQTAHTALQSTPEKLQPDVHQRAQPEGPHRKALAVICHLRENAEKRRTATPQILSGVIHKKSRLLIYHEKWSFQTAQSLGTQGSEIQKECCPKMVNVSRESMDPLALAMLNEATA